MRSMRTWTWPHRVMTAIFAGTFKPFSIAFTSVLFTKTIFCYPQHEFYQWGYWHGGLKPRLSWLTAMAAAFSLRRGLPASRSYVPSTSVLSLPVPPGGFLVDIPSRIDVPVMVGPARGAPPLPDAQRELAQLVPAGRTHRAGGKLPVHDHHPAAGQLGLVFQLPAELVPTHVADVSSQVSGLQHPLDVEVLDADEREPLDQPRSQLVGVVLPEVFDAGVEAPQKLLGALPPAAPLLPSR
jgi:hypothetical protein